jgi:hypothetical protein
MTVQISQRGKEYLERARAAKTMTDSAIAGQLKAVAADYPRGELRKLRMLMRMDEFPDCTERFRDWV